MLIIRHTTHTPLSVWHTFSSLTQNPCGTATDAPGCQSQSPDHSLLEIKSISWTWTIWTLTHTGVQREKMHRDTLFQTLVTFLGSKIMPSYKTTDFSMKYNAALHIFFTNKTIPQYTATWSVKCHYSRQIKKRISLNLKYYQVGQGEPKSPKWLWDLASESDQLRDV